MATVAGRLFEPESRPDLLSGTPRAHAIDRWIYVFTAASFVVITLVGFIPDAIMKVGMVQAGQRPPFPLVMHMHALLMGSFLLLQSRIGILFPLLLTLGLSARGRDAGFHKRMMILAPAMALPAAIDRMVWLPTTLPVNAIATDFYVLLAVSPMLVWDVVRNGRVHRAYWVFLPIYVAASVVVNMAWDTPGWHATARHIMGV